MWHITLIFIFLQAFGTLAFDPCDPGDGKMPPGPACIPPEMLPIPGNCSWFLECFDANRGWIPQQCQTDVNTGQPMWFSRYTHTCSQRFLDECHPECIGGSPAPPPDRGPFDPCDPLGTCFNSNAGQMVGIPGNCTVFYTCQAGQMVPQNCGASTCFSASAVGCINDYSPDRDCANTDCQEVCPTTVTYPVTTADTTVTTVPTTTLPPETTTTTAPTTTTTAATTTTQDEVETGGNNHALAISLFVVCSSAMILSTVVIWIRNKDNRVDATDDEEKKLHDDAPSDTHGDAEEVVTPEVGSSTA